MDDLIARLRAAIDEDERIALAALVATGELWHVGESAAYMGRDSVFDVSVRGSDNGLVAEADPAEAAHIAVHDPARVLAMVAAHRAILAEHEQGSDGTCLGCGEPGFTTNDCPVVLALAEGYGIEP